jgi:hypothetical protein
MLNTIAIRLKMIVIKSWQDIHSDHFFQLGIEGGAQIRAEIFMQLIKQCNQNPSPQSAEKAWGLMMLCFLHFSPGETIENIVQTFIRDHCPSAIRDLMIKQCHKSA